MRTQVDGLKPFLDEVYRQFNTRDSLAHDPLSFVHRYSTPEDIEAVAMIAASFAFGRVAAFMPVIERLLGRMEGHPGAFLREAGPDECRMLANGTVYRFATQDNISALLIGIGGALARHASLKPLFVEGWERGGTVAGLHTLAAGIRRFAAESRAVATDPGFLVPLGNHNSPMKRLCMFLRWMVRDDGLDTGLWRDIPRSDLLIPMDVHVFRISRLIGLLPPCRRTGPTMKDARMVTARLAEFDPLDPVRYDFAISHLGISGRCDGSAGPGCSSCPLATVCSCHRQQPD